MEEAWSYLNRVGVVSGGEFKDIGQGTTCYPYQINPRVAQVYSMPAFVFVEEGGAWDEGKYLPPSPYLFSFFTACAS